MSQSDHISPVHLPFQLKWFGADLPGRPPQEDAESGWALDQMPEVSPSDDLSWLLPLDEDVSRAASAKYSKTIPSHSAPLTDQEQLEREQRLKAHKLEWDQKIRNITSAAVENKVKLPNSFLSFVQSDENLSRIRTPSGNYFDLSDGLFPDPFGSDGFLTLFDCDQQWCALWYLYLPKSGGSQVWMFDTFEAYERLEEVPAGTDPSTALNYVWIVAQSFDEFLYRIWIEGNIWYKNYVEFPLDQTERDYVNRLHEKSQ